MSSELETKAPFPWRAWPGLWARAWLALLSVGTCVFALVLTPLAVGRLCADALDAVDPQQRKRSRSISAGVVAIIHVFVACFAGVLGDSIGHRVEHEALRLVARSVLAVAASIVACAAWAPISLTPSVLIDRDGGVLAALARSFELSARRSARATARDGAIVGVLASVAFVVTSIAEAIVPAVPGPLVLVLCSVLVAPLPALHLARVYVEARSLPSFDPARDPRVIAGVRNVLMLVVPAAAALVMALALAALTPSPMREGAQGLATSITAYQASGPGGEVQLPGPHGLFVRARADGVEIGTADGGGAGAVQITDPFARPRGGMVIAHGALRGRDAWVALVDAPAWSEGRTIERTFVTYFDDEGVRLDDGLADRLSARIGSSSVGLAVFGLFLALVLAFRLTRTLEDARALDAPELVRDAPARESLSRASGTLRLGEDARVTARGATARVHGQARIELEGGAVVIALPPEVAVLELGDEPLVDGSEVTIVARFDRLAPLGLRQGSMPWPDGARLVPTDRDHAAEAVLDRASRVAAFFALGITVSLGLAATLVLMHL